MTLVIEICIGLLGIYAVLGLVFGMYFVFYAAPKIDPLLAESKRSVRFLLLPGIMATWPFFIRKLFTTKTKHL